MRVSTYLRSFVKDLSLKTGIYEQTFFDVYPYMFSPQQLIFMTECLNDTRTIEGCCLEAGCAYGATTVFLNKFMMNQGIEKPYIAIDTFSGFVEDHYSYEIEQRKKRKRIKYSFAENKRDWYDQSISRSGITNVRSIAADITKFDFSSIGPISFCLLDVDLYLPVRETLPKIYNQMSPGGILVVDDCKPNCDWDGSFLAYQEFCNLNGFQEKVLYEKLGILRKPIKS
ncbi:MAG: TylF/MycF/NovP-related O-methyltransferase [Leptospirales bacterium]